MNCDSVSKLIPLYFYGELTPNDEDQLDQHLHECASCTRQMEQQQAVAAALDRRVLEPPSLLLNECRDDLMAAIAGGAPRQVARVKPANKGPWTLFLEAMGATLAGFGRLRQPVGAMALVAVGFLAARYSASPAPQLAVDPAQNVYANVRDVSTGADGRIRLTVDETQRREVVGRADDKEIKRFLLAGSRDSDASVRMESVGLMKNLAGAPDVTDSLLNALATDPNDGVRLRALEALKPMASDPKVSKTLSQVLLNDANPAVRMQVIDLMVTRRDDNVVGVLQHLMQREDNNSVRLKASKILKDWNASIGTF